MTSGYSADQEIGSITVLRLKQQLQSIHMLPSSRNPRKESKPSLESTSKITQQLLRKTRLVQRPLGSEGLSTISTSRWNSKNNSRKQSINQIETKPTVSNEKQHKKLSIEKDRGSKMKAEKRNSICSMTNGQTFQFHIDISKLKKREEEVGKQNFKYLYVIGKGGFGRVWWVENKKSGRKYAMKQMKKSKIIAKRSIHSVMNERNLLSTLKHPFIVNMNYAFQDRDNLYIVLDLLTGGDFRYYLSWKRRFKESEAKFYIGCIILGLEYLHSKNIIHRDIKPQNLVLDEKGYLKITDLGIAREAKPDNSSDTSGTPGYMSPEVMCCQDHSFSADFYAVGIILYEMMLGRRPYRGGSRKEIRDHMLSKQAQVKQAQLPQGWSISSMNIVNKMIQRNPQNRLGNIRIGEIKEHDWFQGFSWSNLSKRVMPAPFVPKPINLNHEYRQQISDSTEENTDSETLLLLRRKNVQELFQDYEYKPAPQDTKRDAAILSSRQESSRMLSTKSKGRNNSQVIHR